MGWLKNKTARRVLFYALWLMALGLLAGTPWLILQISRTSPTGDLNSTDGAVFGSIREPIQPIPREVRLDERKVKLGERLFQDPRLSHDNSIACASCHDLRKGGADHRPKAIGIAGQVGDLNVPTVFNSGLNFKQFWDGRADTLEDQIDGPTHNPKEMGSNWGEIIQKLKKDPGYVSAFAAIYPDGIHSRNIKDAIATFERSLITPNSRFDRFLQGDLTTLTEEEKGGYRLFKEYGCVACHQGVNVGGNMFQKLGVMVDYFAERGYPEGPALGRYNVTKEERDRYTFKVPSLRNVERTAPYFHDGSVPTLEIAVELMAKYQLGRPLSKRDVNLIVKFLKTLTGEYQGNPL